MLIEYSLSPLSTVEKISVDKKNSKYLVTISSDQCMVVILKE